MTHTVSIYHNISRDNWFGLNVTLTRSGRKPADPAHYHPLVLVFRYQTSEAPDLDDIFREFNVGEGDLARAYRARRLRSLSVGDVVATDDGRAWSCESFGWTERRPAELRIVPAAEADQMIRARLDFEPAEPLSVTVPLDASEAPYAKRA